MAHETGAEVASAYIQLWLHDHFAVDARDSYHQFDGTGSDTEQDRRPLPFRHAFLVGDAGMTFTARPAGRAEPCHK